MKRILKVNGRTGLFDAPSFLISENEGLKIRLEVEKELRRGRYSFVVRHGERKKTFILGNHEEIELAPEWLNESAENLEFSLALLNEWQTAVVKDDYQIEPLKIENVSGIFQFVAIVQELLENNQALEERVSGLESKLTEFEAEGVPLLTEEENAE